MIPSPGRIVEYTLDAHDVQRIVGRREDARTQASFILHAGNPVRPGDTYPLMITKVWGSTGGSAVNGQVMLDGNDTLWVTSVTEGEGERHFRPFPRV